MASARRIQTQKCYSRRFRRTTARAEAQPSLSVGRCGGLFTSSMYFSHTVIRPTPASRADGMRTDGLHGRILEGSSVALGKRMRSLSF